MIKNIFSFIIISAILVSCGSTGKKDISSKSEGVEKGEKVEFSSLVANPENYVGKTITIEGKVVHVCTETGKKMFIVGDNPDLRLFIAAGENISKFPMELLGSEITVEGLITRVGGTIVASNDPVAKEMGAVKSPEGEMKKENCETETALAGQPSLSNIRMQYKSHTVK
jgi:RecJ-like exonuclease